MIKHISREQAVAIIKEYVRQNYKGKTELRDALSLSRLDIHRLKKTYNINIENPPKEDIQLTEINKVLEEHGIKIENTKGVYYAKTRPTV